MANTKNSSGTSSTKKSTAAKTSAAKTTETKKSSSTSAGTNSKPAASKSGTTKKSSKKSKKLPTAVVVIFVVLFGIWYFCGKPTIAVTGDGISIAKTEDPTLIEKILYGEPEPAQTEEKTVAETPSEPAAKTQAEKPAQKPAEASNAGGTKSASGTSGSNAACDKGNAENSPLYLGNPSDAVADTSKGTNYLMVKPQYTLSYNNETLCPNWVAWHLSKDDIGEADRSNDFRPDEELPSDWYAVKKADYNYNIYGYDRGHVCPSADRTKTQEDNSMTFLMTNMVPQSPDNNRVVWNHFEAYERQIALDGNEIYIVAGPYGTGGTGAKGYFDTVDFTDKKTKKSYKMNVPESTWKVIVILPYGDNDINRIDENTTTIAINVPNGMGIAKEGDWEQYITSIDAIEEMTGYDFFELLPDDIEDKLESKVYQYSK